MNRKGTGKLRDLNDLKVLQYFIDYKSGTKKEVACQQQLTTMTTNTIFNEFLARNIIIEDKIITHEKGRPTQSYMINKDYFHLLMIIVRRIYNTYTIICKIQDATNNTIHYTTNQYDTFDINILYDLIQECLKDPYIKEIGIGLPVLIVNNEIIDGDIKELIGVDISYIVFEKFNKKAYIYNDMNATALGYYHHIEEECDLCFVTFPYGSGPGCGTIINGKLLVGKNKSAGEIVYLPFFHFLKERSFDYSNEQKAKAIISLASILNPKYILLTGEMIKQEDIDDIKSICKQYMPYELMPDILYIEDYNEYYLEGIHTLLLDNQRKL